MYTVKNFRSKKDFKAAVAAEDVYVQRYTNNGPFEEYAGTGYFEGPHYPQPHKWYASAEVVSRDGALVILKGSRVK